jgi:hypothetical protein
MFVYVEYLPDEKCFFILSPYDIVKAEQRHYDDHIDFLIQRKKFDDAIQAFLKPPSVQQRPERHTLQVRQDCVSISS